MQLAERVAEVSPAMVILSHLPPEPLAQARYQVRRLRARFAALPIVVGRWGEAGSDAASEGLSGVGPTHVAFTLADARDQILARAASAAVMPARDDDDGSGDRMAGDDAALSPSTRSAISPGTRRSCSRPRSFYPFQQRPGAPAPRPRTRTTAP